MAGLIEQGGPALAKLVWSASDCHFFYPTSVTWDGSNTALIVAKNHYLSTSDVVSLTSFAGSGWTLSNKTITVVDKDTFTFPLASNPGSGNVTINLPEYHTYPVPAQLNGPTGYNDLIKVTCTKYSKLMFRPVTIEHTVPASTNIAFEGIVHQDSTAFISLGTVTGAGTPTLFSPTPVVNLVRGRITSGSGQPVVKYE